MIECWNPAPPPSRHIVRIVKLDMAVFHGGIITGDGEVGTLQGNGVITHSDGYVSYSTAYPYLVWMNDGKVARANRASLATALQTFGQEWGD